MIEKFTNPFDAILEFESELALFTGAPYAITVDCCTHALELCFRVERPAKTSFPAKTYLSVPMLMHKLNINYTLIDYKWNPSYKFTNTRIWDCARHLTQDMFLSGQLQCVSFGRTKPLEIGLGGAILTDDVDLYKKFSKMRYDGRDIFNFSPWHTQDKFEVGYHYYMRPEEACIGLQKMKTKDFNPQYNKYFDYPDCNKISIS